MLNPSTADAEFDDPTIRRCIRFAREAGHGSLIVGNLFAWRATDPAELLSVNDPIGPENDLAISEIANGASIVVCAWGAKPFGGRDAAVLSLISKANQRAHCLKLTRKGHPAHPLYLPASLRPVPMVSTS